VKKLAGTISILLLVGMAIATSVAHAQPQRPTDAQIKKAIIRQSVASYPGNCPCPYNVARNGSMCGRRSAYSKTGGYAPMCYPADVSKAAVEAYRRSQ
jgi:hypothetical protein